MSGDDDPAQAAGIWSSQGHPPPHKHEHACTAAVADAFMLKEAGRNTAAVSVPVFASALASLAVDLLLDMPTAYLSDRDPHRQLMSSSTFVLFFENLV